MATFQIKNLSGKTHSVEIDNRQTFEDVIQLLKNAWGLSADSSDYRIIANGAIVDVNATVGDYNLGNESVVHGVLIKIHRDLEVLSSFDSSDPAQLLAHQDRYVMLAGNPRIYFIPEYDAAKRETFIPQVIDMPLENIEPFQKKLAEVRAASGSAESRIPLSPTQFNELIVRFTGHDAEHRGRRRSTQCGSRIVALSDVDSAAASSATGSIAETHVGVKSFGAFPEIPGRTLALSDAATASVGSALALPGGPGLVKRPNRAPEVTAYLQVLHDLVGVCRVVLGVDPGQANLRATTLGDESGTQVIARDALPKPEQVRALTRLFLDLYGKAKEASHWLPSHASERDMRIEESRFMTAELYNMATSLGMEELRTALELTLMQTADKFIQNLERTKMLEGTTDQRGYVESALEVFRAVRETLPLDADPSVVASQLRLEMLDSQDPSRPLSSTEAAYRNNLINFCTYPDREDPFVDFAMMNMLIARMENQMSLFAKRDVGVEMGGRDPGRSARNWARHSAMADHRTKVDEAPMLQALGGALSPKEQKSHSQSLALMCEGAQERYQALKDRAAASSALTVDGRKKDAVPRSDAPSREGGAVLAASHISSAAHGDLRGRYIQFVNELSENKAYSHTGLEATLRLILQALLPDQRTEIAGMDYKKLRSTCTEQCDMIRIHADATNDRMLDDALKQMIENPKPDYYGNLYHQFRTTRDISPTQVSAVPSSAVAAAYSTVSTLSRPAPKPDQACRDAIVHLKAQYSGLFTIVPNGVKALAKLLEGSSGDIRAEAKRIVTDALGRHAGDDSETKKRYQAIAAILNPESALSVRM